MTAAAVGPGTVLGKYRVVRLIGAGGMGAVYEANHVQLGKRVAVKVLLPALAAHTEARARFLREAEALTRVRHPNVVNVTDYGNEGGAAYLVMEYLDGETLADRLARQGRLATGEALDILLPVVDALANGHDRGVVHRDLKPPNIFLAPDPMRRIVPKLLDFGVSKDVASSNSLGLTRSGALLGTAQYMAPEQIEGAKDVDGRADQYSLGLVLFECLAGYPARQGDQPFVVLERALAETVPSIRVARPDVSSQLEAAISRSLALRPAERFPNMWELMRALVLFANADARSIWAEVVVRRSLAQQGADRTNPAW